MPDASGFTMSDLQTAVVYDDDVWDEAQIPRRPWVARGYYLRGAITEIVGGPGFSKSALMVASAVALALKAPYHKMLPEQACRVMLYNVEDDANEQRRRLSGALQYFGATPEDIRGKVARIGPTHVGTLLRQEKDDVTGEVGLVFTEALCALRQHIEAFRPDVLILDPLVELHDVEENDNTAVRSVMAQFRSMAAKYNLALVLIHHTRKGAMIPGDVDSSRGASAMIGAARIVLTIAGMTEDDARAFGVADDIRRQFFRLDGGKANYSRLSDVEWFDRVERTLANGDTVAIPEPWMPPEDLITPETRAKVEAGIEKGHSDGPWSPLLALKHARSVKHLLIDCGVTTLAGQTSMIRALLSDGFIDAKFRHRETRKIAKGIRSPSGQPRNVDWVDADTLEGDEPAELA